MLQVWDGQCVGEKGQMDASALCLVGLRKQVMLIIWLDVCSTRSRDNSTIGPPMPMICAAELVTSLLGGILGQNFWHRNGMSRPF